MNTVENEEALVCEALVREISFATRWQSVVEAWTAILHVRLMAKSMKEELAHHNSQSSRLGPRGAGE